MNSRFQAALKGQVTKTPPIWMMRQAGRYHAHYQNLRKSNSFVELCKKPKLAAEVALGPVMDFDFDLAILFSDLLFPLEALGMGLTYDNGGPELTKGLDQKLISQFRSLEKALPFLQFQKEAMQETRKVLPSTKSLIGFVGGPWTLFVYAIEGSHKGNLVEVKKTAEVLFPLFCEHMVPLLRENIRLQLEGGAEAVMILDTAAGELSPYEFRDWTAEPLLQMLSEFSGQVGYYAKGSTSSIFDTLRQLNQGRAKFGIGVDHRFEVAPYLQEQEFQFIQGNFDQILLHLDPKSFEKRLREFLKPMLAMTPAERTGWVCGVGHGLIPTTPEENVRAFVRIVREVFA